MSRLRRESTSFDMEADLISRQGAIDAFDGVKFDVEYCTEYGIGYNDGIDFAVSTLSVLPSARPKIKCIANITMTDEQIQEVFEKVKADILAVQPEGKKGKNICDSVAGHHCEFKCSVCGVEIGVVEGGDLDGAYGFKFCPGCGAEIEES